MSYYDKITYIILIFIATYVIPAKSQEVTNFEKVINVDEKGKGFTLSATPFKPLLFSDDHTSEGFLAPLNDGRILLVFRLDPGIVGDHVGTEGYIAKIPYDPEQDRWGKVETVYNSNRYDDRNIHGGVTKDGRIVTFFRRYDGSKTEGRYFIYSDDNGHTWSEPQISQAWFDPHVSNLKGVWSTGQMFYNPDIDKYAMLGCRRYITFSQNGISWEAFNQITNDQDFKLSEIAGAWCGDNRVIALIRDDKRQHGHPLMQVESHDNGQTWTKPVPTNIPPNQHFGAAPQLIYDQSRDLLIALTSDRYSRPDERNSLFIYTARPKDVIGNPEGWNLQYELRRPWAGLGFDGNRPLNQNFYGYPTIAPINAQEYLIVFTERSKMNGTEQADLYYFRLTIS
jgi:hypothetical protein